MEAPDSYKMILVLRQHSSSSEIQSLMERLRKFGLAPKVIRSAERTLLEVAGELAPDHCGALEDDPAVELVVPSVDQPTPNRRPAGGETRQVLLRPGGFVIGGPKVGVIAGPCSVEDRSLLLETAHAVKEAGAVGLRGGAFKPRTNPYSFQGLGERALEFLAEAREQTGLAIVTEVMSEDQAPLVARYADLLQIGARNMHNFNLLSAVGRTGKPVLLKRGWSATLEELLLAAEYITSEGDSDVILCERGIRTFESYVRNTLALAVVPAIKQRSSLPILVDPSHGVGIADLVAPMAKAAIACGADGLLLEVHPHPEQALTDGSQTLSITQFQTLMEDVQRVAVAVGRG